MASCQGSEERPEGDAPCWSQSRHASASNQNARVAPPDCEIMAARSPPFWHCASDSGAENARLEEEALASAEAKGMGRLRCLFRWCCLPKLFTVCMSRFSPSAAVMVFSTAYNSDKL